tara:strand:+ start:245 stop:1546 length:1302 start_codon:yes stop_codon:yes gene_type:complete
MKTLNVYPIDWNTDEHWIIEARDEFDWVEGMFHKKIINEIDLDLKINHLNKFEQLEKLSKERKPYVIFVKMYQLEYITERSILKHFFGYGKNKFIIDDINSGKCKLIFASLTEFCNYDYFIYMNKFKKQLKHYNISEEKIVIFDFMNNLENAKKKFDTNIQFKYFNWLMVAWKHYINIPKTIDNVKEKDYKREKYFITLNKSVKKQHRPFLLYYLWKNDLLDKGFVSFFYEKEFKSAFKDNMTNSYQEFVRLSENEIDKFIDWLENNPLYVDVDKKEFEDNKQYSGAPNEIFNDKTDNAYKNSYFNILTESSFIESNTEFDLDFYVNERNSFPITAFQPFIAVNGHHHMKKLQELGFKTFHPHIDETYDSIQNSAVRFYLITKEISRLCSMSKQEIHDWYWEMEDILKHNHTYYYKEFIPKQIKGFYDEFIYE